MGVSTKTLQDVEPPLGVSAMSEKWMMWVSMREVPIHSLEVGILSFFLQDSDAFQLGQGVACHPTSKIRNKRQKVVLKKVLGCNTF